tara:strand:- start:18571 stop:19608 length:1038 start_codon:yes stop_codon:yes gene_type:complete
MTVIPGNLEDALTPEWLGGILPSHGDGSRIVDVEEVARVQDIDFKPKVVRFKVRYEDGSSMPLCLKAVFSDPNSKASNQTAVHEARFFGQIAPHLSIRLPSVAAAPIDEERGVGLILMGDLAEDGARFVNVLEPWDVAWVSDILEQMARLHAVENVIGPVDNLGWIRRNVEWLPQVLTVERLEALMSDSRRAGLPGRTGDARLAIESMHAFAAIDRERPPFLIHGDAHASNIFILPEGPGLMDWQMLQKGSWALDVAYHINAVLPVEIAEREERALFEYYLDRAREYGANPPELETAWLEYRQSLVYGYFLAVITRSFPQPLIDETCKRLAHAVDRHDTFRLLGV